MKEEGEVGNVTGLRRGDDTVDFTAVLSTSVGVRSRRRKASNEFKEKKPKLKKEEDKEEGEEAFIFFRPKKGRRWFIYLEFKRFILY